LPEKFSEEKGTRKESRKIMAGRGRRDQSI
jgi:hypothetical protein